MVLKRAKCDWNGIKIAIFAKKSLKITQQLGALPPLWHAWVASVCSARGPKLDNFCAKNIHFWFKPPLSKQNPVCATGGIHSCWQIFQAIVRAAYETSE